MSGNVRNEERHIQRIRSGDAQAFKDMFNQYQPKLFRFVWHLVRSVEASEDLVQNVFLRIWHHRQHLPETTSLSAYLYRAARNSALNYLRDEKTTVPHNPNIAALDSEGPDRQYQLGELDSLIRRAIDALPEGCRTVFILSRYHDLKYKEIADVLQVSVKTVENQMGRALRLLRNQLADVLKDE